MTPRLKGLARTVSNRIIAHSLPAFVQAGISPEAFVRHTGIALDDLIDPQGRIEGVRHRRVVELAASMSVPRGMLELNVTDLFHDYPVLGNLCINARTLRTAIGHYLAYRGLIGEFDFLLCRQSATRIQFEYISEFAPQASFQALANFMSLIALIRAYDQRAQTVFHAEFVGVAPPFASSIAQCFGAPVRFAQSANRLWFDSVALDTPVPQHNAALEPWLQAQAQQELTRIQRLHLFSANVETLIREFLADPANDQSGASLLQQLCQRLNTTRWTLRRQLQQEGTHFRELELKVKTGESRRLLSETALSVAQISEQLGFASQSAFTRFFKARHALPPLSYRQHTQTAGERKLA
ncbi:helix-turn-helix transcriptional regulator [Silvimonas soli]|uniref:helix-turn-helix transcriptional regulator n=1 Tax=Silvimonas soli TaxID=2980100 RepID=UPI0024B33D06|nr:AraC family transcriptional regulator [Silvimonas soli]